ncbi:hypothetical protein J2Y41_003906 [Arthrobacter sp. 1088]|nr:hypothetical protein [Arthrobacter sp. 1088]
MERAQADQASVLGVDAVLDTQIPVGSFVLPPE